MMKSFLSFLVFATCAAINLFASGPATAATYHWIGPSGKPSDPPDGWHSSVPLIAKADVAAGKARAQMCTMCHTVDSGGGTKIGPTLYNIVNRPHAHVYGYEYSDAMKDMKMNPWSYEELDSFLYDPRAHAPGTKMSFPGIKDTQGRANVIAWLRTLSDHPAPLPK